MRPAGDALPHNEKLAGAFGIPELSFPLRGKGYFHSKPACARQGRRHHMMKDWRAHLAYPNSVFRCAEKGIFISKWISIFAKWEEEMN